MATSAAKKKGLESSRPRGREEVSEAVIAAARKLFASRPVKDVTMRDIAEGADVNLGLLHRHFGSKEQILKAVVDSYAGHFKKRISLGASPSEALLSLLSSGESAPFLRTLAHMVLADVPMREFVTHDGVIHILVSKPATQARQAADQPDNVNPLVAFALYMGWSLFGDFLVEAAEPAVTQEQLRQTVFTLLQSMLLPQAQANKGTTRKKAAVASLTPVAVKRSRATGTGAAVARSARAAKR